MEPVENLVVQLRALSPHQLDRVARMVREISRSSSRPDGNGVSAQPSAVPAPVVEGTVVETAVQNGWPAGLFTQVIGGPGADFERAPQDSHEVRQTL